MILCNSSVIYGTVLSGPTNTSSFSSGNLKLLNAAGPHEANIKAFTSVMDLKHVTVKANLQEIEAWRNICAQSDVIQCLKFQWDPKCDSLLDDRIFDFFVDVEKRNRSISEIEMSMFHGEIKRASDPLYKTSTDSFTKEVILMVDGEINIFNQLGSSRPSVFGPE